MCKINLAIHLEKLEKMTVDESKIGEKLFSVLARITQETSMLIDSRMIQDNETLKAIKRLSSLKSIVTAFNIRYQNNKNKEILKEFLEKGNFYHTFIRDTDKILKTLCSI